MVRSLTGGPIRVVDTRVVCRRSCRVSRWAIGTRRTLSLGAVRVTIPRRDRTIRENRAMSNTLPAMKELPDRWRDLGEFIREQRSTARLSLRRLSEQAGISNPYLSQIERGLRKPSAEILQQIAKALRISAETLYVRAGILEERDLEDLEGEILRDQHLTEDQKQTLIKVYQSFRHENEDRLVSPPVDEVAGGDDDEDEDEVAPAAQ
jgi:transcriptional regulator with XRE-family HTH domain